MDMTSYPQSQHLGSRDPVSHPQYKSSGDYGPSTPRGFPSAHDEPLYNAEPSFKRQRTSTDLTNRTGYELPNRIGYDLQNRVTHDPMSRVAQDPPNREARELPNRATQDLANRGPYDLANRGNYDVVTRAPPYDSGNQRHNTDQGLGLGVNLNIGMHDRRPNHFDHEQRYVERSYEDPRGTYNNAYTTRNLPPPAQTSSYNPPGFLGGVGLGAREGGSRTGERKGYGP